MTLAEVTGVTWMAEENEKEEKEEKKEKKRGEEILAGPPIEGSTEILADLKTDNLAPAL